jgi:hypothetical protein
MAGSDGESDSVGSAAAVAVAAAVDGVVMTSDGDDGRMSAVTVVVAAVGLTNLTSRENASRCATAVAVAQLLLGCRVLPRSDAEKSDDGDRATMEAGELVSVA